MIYLTLPSPEQHYSVLLDREGVKTSGMFIHTLRHSVFETLSFAASFIGQFFKARGLVTGSLDIVALTSSFDGLMMTSFPAAEGCDVTLIKLLSQEGNSSTGDRGRHQFIERAM